MRAASAARSHNRARYDSDRPRVLRAELTWRGHRNHQKAGARAYRGGVDQVPLEHWRTRDTARSLRLLMLVAFEAPAKVACSVFFTTTREATPSCLLPHNTGNGISGHTSRRQTHQSRHAGYPRRNLGRSGGIARVGRAVELRCAMRGSRMPTNLQAPPASFASD